MDQLESLIRQPVIVPVHLSRHVLPERQRDEPAAAPGVTEMGADASLLIEESSSRLPLAGKSAGRREEDEVAPALGQAGPRSDVAGRDDQSPLLEIADRRTGRSLDQKPPGRQAATGPIGRAPAADHSQARGVELGGELGAGVALELDEGLPGTGDPRYQEPLTLDALEPDVPLAQG